MAMSRDDYLKDHYLGSYSTEHKHNITIEYLITLKGEVVPFNWIARLAVIPFDNIDSFADTLTTPPNPMNEMYAILHNGENVAFDLGHMDFTSHISVNQHGQYLSQDVIKRILQTQFAQTNKEMQNGNQERITCRPKVDGTVSGDN